MIIVATDEPNVYEAAKRHFKLDDKGLLSNNGVVLGSDNSGEFPVIISGNITPGLVAHEAKHVVNMIFLNLGIQLDKRNDEHETYFLSWVVNRIWEVKTKLEKKIEDEKSTGISK